MLNTSNYYIVTPHDDKTQNLFDDIAFASIDEALTVTEEKYPKNDKFIFTFRIITLKEFIQNICNTHDSSWSETEYTMYNKGNVTIGIE